jgi:hypothetical protein
MSKLTNIQAELEEIGQAKFQQLCDAYIYKKFGFSKIKIIGSVRGKEKTAK